MFQGTFSTSVGKRSTDELIRIIDLRVASLRESIRVLNNRRNDHVPISKLPVEIVTEILLLHQQNVMRRNTTQKVALDWIGITHIYRRWREIALNFSPLWVHIPFHNPMWAKEMIARSLHACPIVTATYDPLVDLCEAQILKNFLQQHLCQVQVLDISSAAPHLVAQLFQHVIQPTFVPCLSTLKISIPLARHWQPPSSPDLDLLQIIDSRLLNTKSLNKIEVPTILRWDLSLFTGLKYLKVGNDDSRNTPRTQTTQREFLDTLRRMPALQFLYLRGNVLPAAAVDRPSLEPVHLRNLRDLNVFDTLNIIEFFLLHIIFPETTRTSIGCKHVDPMVQLANVSPVIDLLKQRLAGPNALKLHHIRYSCLCECSFQGQPPVLKFEGWESESSPKRRSSCNPHCFPSSNPDFEFFLECESFVDRDGLSVGMFEIFPRDQVV